MTNMVCLVGRIANIEKDAVKIAVVRSYKNVEGIYETDFINCVLYSGISEKVNDWCKIGDIIGIKGRLQTKDNELIVIADKVSFLSSRSKENA